VSDCVKALAAPTGFVAAPAAPAALVAPPMIDGVVEIGSTYHYLQNLRLKSHGKPRRLKSLLRLQ